MSYTLLRVLPFGAHYVENGTLTISNFVMCIILSLGFFEPSESGKSTIARAIMKDAPVIILDEATANVNPENEKELVDAREQAVSWKLAH